MPSTKPSKSARKREFLALQSLGEQLIGLTDEQLSSIALDENLLDAVRAAREMQAHGALRRQKQLIGKLMRHVDPEPIERALASFGQHDGLAKKIFREAEQWRDRLAKEGQQALPEFFAVTGGENRELGKHVKDYQATTHEKARRLLRRRMFSEIHKELALKMQSTPR